MDSDGSRIRIDGRWLFGLIQEQTQAATDNQERDDDCDHKFDDAREFPPPMW